MTMKKLISKLALSGASVLVLGLGCAALGQAAEPNAAANTAGICPPLQVSDGPSTEALLRKADIRWAQTELRFRGLYHGSLDGTLGPETKDAILRLQKNAGLGRTASLDAQTWAALTGERDVGEGSSTPPSAGREAPITNSTPASGLGR